MAFLRSLELVSLAVDNVHVEVRTVHIYLGCDFPGRLPLTRAVLHLVGGTEDVQATLLE